ncbi:hypothetical protein [Roseomonas xinghualingensis]|uniref:hypothetical protein n=1 Tax=Roseomonas xinghualingensis TaxID=2986475 RepID=UPI0021F0B840|nr:hypothetical protein [Roseomonas sp. SXEYE001]MCV4209867.1 hypothetical protein [Roseomonas sp. SXEYE001]
MRYSPTQVNLATLPADADLKVLPKYVDRQRAAALVTHYFFGVSARSLERWPLAGKVINGRLIVPLADVFRIARERMDAAPAIKSGPATASRAD